MLPTYEAVVQKEQEDQAQERHRQDPRGGDIRRSVEQPEVPSQTYQRFSLPVGEQTTTTSRRQQHLGATSTSQSARDGVLEMNSAFLQSPAGGLLAASSILGLLLGICGSVPLWSEAAGGRFCVMSGLLHFCGCSFLFFAYLFNYVNDLPWYNRPLTVYYYLVCSGISLLAFVYSASSSARLQSAAIASAVFSFFAMAVDIVLIVLSYIALKMGYVDMQPRRDASEA